MEDMTMTRVENTSERQYDMSAPGKGTVSIPARGQVGADGKAPNGAADVDDDFLAEAKKDKVVKAWFDSGDLVMGKGGGAKAAAAPGPAILTGPGGESEQRDNQSHQTEKAKK
jgi:hypothetical protein